MDFGKVDAANATLRATSAELTEKWTAARSRYDLGYGQGGTDKLLQALLSYYSPAATGIFAAANPLPGRLLDLAAAGQAARQRYFEADTAGRQSFGR